MTIAMSDKGGVSISTARRVHTFIEIVSNLKEWEDKESQRNSLYSEAKLLFRGHANAAYELKPSIVREKNYSGRTLLEKERDLIETAKYMSPEVFRSDYQPLEQLALLRHHSMPTRLLDVSSNALVSLYFACCDRKDSDGEVIVFTDNRRNPAINPVYNAIADTCRLTKQVGFTSLKEFVERMKKEPYGYEIQGKEECDAKWLKECCSKPIFVNAPFHSRRQQAQSGRYILFPNEIVEVNGVLGFSNAIVPIEKYYPVVRKIIRIPKEEKEKIVAELEWMGIDEASLFVDNPDKMCDQIAKGYKRELKIET